MTTGNHSCCDKLPVKKGLWSPEEDARLTSFITASGSGSWSTISRTSGLQRCGKSCRFRWKSNLKPGLKRGPWSNAEIQSLFDLQKQLGNKWSQIGKFFPGRTQNDIKNFWNSGQRKWRVQQIQGNSSNSPAAAIVNPNIPNPNFTFPIDTPHPTFFDGLDQVFTQQVAIGGGGNDPAAEMVAVGGDPAAEMVVDGGGDPMNQLLPAAAISPVDPLLEELLMISSSSGEIPPPPAPPADSFFEGLGF